MATEKEQTLQIKQFRGVNRFTEGTAQEPDVFEVIQNMSVANPGELKAINGVTELGTIKGLTKILHVQKYQTDQDNGIVVIGESDKDVVLSAPTGWTITPVGSGASVINYDLFIEYIYAGGGSISTKYNFSHSELVLDLRTFTIEKTSGSIPDDVISVNYWIGYSNLKYIFTITAPTSTVHAGAVYSVGGNNYTSVASVYSDSTKFLASGSGNPPSSGTLTKVSGTGPTTIAYSVRETTYVYLNPTNYAAQNNLIYLGSSYRVNGSFKTNKLYFTAPYHTGPNGTLNVDYITCPFPPGELRYSTYFDANGNLEGGRTYFIGLSKWIYNGPTYTSVAYAASGTLKNTNAIIPMSIYIPKEHNAVEVSFFYCPNKGLLDGGTGQINGSFRQTYGTIFIGETPEDMIPAATLNDNNLYVGNNGVGFSNAQNGEIFSGSFASFTTNSTEDTLTTTNVKIPPGSILQMTSATTAGLTQNQFYYVKTSAPSGTSGSVISLSLTPGGTVVDITASANVTLEWSDIGPAKIVDCPHSVQQSCFTQSLRSDFTLTPDSVAGRGAGIFTPVWRSVFIPSFISYQPQYIHAVYFDNKNLFSSRRDLFWNLGQVAVNINNYGWVETNQNYVFSSYSKFFEMLNGKEYTWQSRMYGNRLWIVNGFCEPFYITRNMLKSGTMSPISGSDTYQRWPIARHIEFFKNRMCLSNTAANPSYTQNYVYFSDSKGDITYFHTSGGTPRAIPVNSGDQSIINGLNIYSQDLSAVGAETFLVIGKEESVFVWDGDPAKNPRQVSKNTGYAGPNCYTLTSFGPVFVGTDNVYLFRTSQDIVPIGYNFKDIIENLSSTNLKNVSAVFHNDQVKIGYTDETNLDREIWFKIIQIQGGLNNHWSGPHIMQAYIGQCVSSKWDSEDHVRVSFLNNKLYQRDDPGSFSNVGQDIQRRIKIRNLGLQADQFLKLITRLHLHLRTTEDENFDMTLESEDGSQSIVVNFTDIYNPTRHMKQVIIPKRWLARVLTLSLENTNNSDLSIYDFSILFQPMRRRLLP